MPMPLAEARRIVESAALGISIAARYGDMPYIRQRHAELLAAAAHLVGLPQEVLRLKAERQLRAGTRGDGPAAERAATEILRLLTLCS